MEIETSGRAEGEEQDEGEDRQKERAQAAPAPNVEKPAKDPSSCSQTEKQSLWPPVSSLLTSF